MAETRSPRIDFYESSARLLSALANASRLEILNLVTLQEISVGALCEKIQLSQSATSQHLARLRLAGLVKPRRDAQTVYYTSNSAPVIKVLEALGDIFADQPRKAALGG